MTDEKNKCYNTDCSRRIGKFQNEVICDIEECKERKKLADKNIFQIRIGRDIYVIDKFYYKKVRRLRVSMNNMRNTIKAYNNRIKTKEEYLKEIYADIKGRFKKQIRR